VALDRKVSDLGRNFGSVPLLFLVSGWRVKYHPTLTCRRKD
jgi:hypothetical protein